MPVRFPAVKFVIPEPLPEMMPPLLTTRLVEIVTLDTCVWAAVQTLVELKSVRPGDAIQRAMLAVRPAAAQSTELLAVNGAFNARS